MNSIVAASQSPKGSAAAWPQDASAMHSTHATLHQLRTPQPPLDGAQLGTLHLFGGHRVGGGGPTREQGGGETIGADGSAAHDSGPTWPAVDKP